MRFVAYAEEARIADIDRGKELLSLLDESFRLVYQNGFFETKDFIAVQDCLQLRYGKSGMALEWQMKLQSCAQWHGESLLKFAGELRMIASKAFPDWSNAQRGELVRIQFIQGVASPTVQVQWMKEMPATIDAALETARKLVAVELAQKRLYRERRGSEQMVTTATLAPVTVNDSVKDKLDRLAADVQRLTEQMSSLTKLPPNRSQAQRRGSSLQCWHCKQPGHIRRECPILQQSPLNLNGPAEEVYRRP